jgi:terminase large subunit-like protein
MSMTSTTWKRSNAAIRRRGSACRSCAVSASRSAKGRSRNFMPTGGGSPNRRGCRRACGPGCRGTVEFEPGEPLWLGVDVGGNRSATGVCWLNSMLHAGIAIFEGDAAVFDAADVVMQLAEQFTIREIAYDPWRAAAIVKAFEQRGIKCTAWPWTDSRVIPAASQLYDAIVEGKLVHDGDETLARHMALVVGRATRRGLRIDKANEADQIDGASALLMAFEAATAPPPQQTKVPGWL